MDLKDTIIKQLAAPVKRKGTQDYMTDEEGNIVTSEAAIGMIYKISLFYRFVRIVSANAGVLYFAA